MDPYVYYEYGNQKHKTTIAKGQGLKPHWENEIKVFSLERNQTNMRVSVYDREVFRWDDLVG
jgi:Ca2+-dependent lipid-binding protein